MLTYYSVQELGGSLPRIIGIQNRNPPADLMYIEEANESLVQSLEMLSSLNTEILMAYGRNRFAEASFLKMAARKFKIEDVAAEELDTKFQCLDVRVLRIRKQSHISEG